MLIPTSLLEIFIFFVCLSVFRWFFYCVLIPFRHPSVPRRTVLFMTLLVPSLFVGYHPTVSPLPDYGGGYYRYILIALIPAKEVQSLIVRFQSLKMGADKSQKVTQTPHEEQPNTP